MHMCISSENKNVADIIFLLNDVIGVERIIYVVCFEVVGSLCDREVAC